MATASGSITDSMAQDDTPEKLHHLANYKFHKCTFGQKKAVSHAFQSAWFSKWQAHATQRGPGHVYQVW